ncbi:hypothetical protein [Halomonas sp. BC04]|uniref:hypothetical protein n=1 Tax=Halomonas sp. BC04 TaxID=1403540 RepID=UPI0003ED625C|nr:hypothetical protein [Halomonas sp. BC04]EWG98105.1 hypothetical protein Q427_32460 [Halomonas sp. BC04]
MKSPIHSPILPHTPAAMMDVWQLGVMAFELWSTSLSTIALRNNLWQTQAPNSDRVIKENQRMVSEKLEASLETGFEMQKAMLGMAFGQNTPWWVTGRRTLSPYHRRSSANSRRLSRS